MILANYPPDDVRTSEEFAKEYGEMAARVESHVIPRPYAEEALATLDASLFYRRESLGVVLRPLRDDEIVRPAI